MEDRVRIPVSRDDPDVILISSDPTSDTEVVSEQEPETILSSAELEKSFQAFEQSLKMRQELSQIEEVTEEDEPKEFPTHFSDTDRHEAEIQDALTEMDTYDPDTMKPLHERDRKLEERIKKLVETTKE